MIRVGTPGACKVQVSWDSPQRGHPRESQRLVPLRNTGEVEQGGLLKHRAPQVYKGHKNLNIFGGDCFIFLDF